MGTRFGVLQPATLVDYLLSKTALYDPWGHRGDLGPVLRVPTAPHQ